MNLLIFSYIGTMQNSCFGGRCFGNECDGFVFSDPQKNPIFVEIKESAG